MERHLHRRQKTSIGTRPTKVSRIITPLQIWIGILTTHTWRFEGAGAKRISAPPRTHFKVRMLNHTYELKVTTREDEGGEYEDYADAAEMAEAQAEAA